ncbi:MULTISPECIES: hypothetical protein [Streptomyces]|uniref:hypothetical protein n=1 Tax=Streptomyces TaxID=1883 RepID=UPI0008237EA9|nr:MULTISPECIES: hypothetical protein [unclassified Streptomyces]WST68298.1 hypothetical protein OG268_12740 [Streptomyces uncialis]SCK17214.1 hypothetical protein YW7DRAFT_01184 [Streptomyces sp. AmelKG-E11A]
MLWLMVVGSAVIGLVLAGAALRTQAHRLPMARLVFTTGVSGALLGVFVTRTALGDPGVATTLVGAVAVSVALLSLLLRPERLRGSAPLAPLGTRP